MTKNEQIQEIDDLLIGFDELGFRPTIPLPDPEATAVRWRNKLVNALKDYRKVERGEWVKKDGFYICSNCERTKPFAIIKDEIHYFGCGFCPRCGADMRGDKDAEIH